MKEEKQRRRIAVALALGILAAQWPVCPVYAVADGEEAVRGDGQYVVAAKTETALAIAEEKYDSGPLEEYTDENHMQEENITVLELTPKEAAALEDMPEIRYVEENILFEGLSDVSPVEAQDPIEKKKARLGNRDYRDEQWNLEAIHLGSATGGNDPVRVAVLDSGVLYTDDIDVEEDIRVMADDQETDARYIDVPGHGTAMAGIIAAKDNEKGIRGIAPEARVVSVKVLDDNNQATLGGVVDGIYTAIEKKCDIINMSFGTSTDSAILHQAIRDASDAGILLVAAAGNDKGDIMYPAAYPEVMAVYNVPCKVDTAS